MNPIFRLFGVIAIKNDEANSAIDDTTQKAKDLGTELEGAGTSADTVSGKMNESSKFGAAAHWMGEMLYKLTEKAVNLGTNLTKVGFGFNASIESYQYSFAALLQDEDKAKQLVADIQELAKVSPLGLEGLANNAVSLLTTGTELAEIIPTLEMLGNLALGDPAHMNSVVRAFTQIISKGGLMAQEMYQLGDAMVPIRDIMTKYGGERYADGSWYEKKMTDPTFKIPAEDMIKAFQAATAEGGQWHDYMFQIMSSYNGMVDRLGEEGKETLGEFFNPFFEMAKSEVIPKLIESLDKFRTWISENQETLTKLADAVGNIINVGFDAFLGALQWMMDNGEATATAIGAIATAMTIAAVAAHPYAAAVTAIVAALALMNARNADGDTYNHFFGKYTDKDLATLQKWVDAVNEYNTALDAWDQTGSAEDESAFSAAADKLAQARKDVDAIEGLLGTYESWRTGQAANTGKNLYLDVPLRAADDAEATIQGEVDGYDIESVVTMLADTSGLQAAVNATNLTASVSLQSSGVSTGVRWISNLPGFATGLDEVPYDNYIARLHKGEAVLNSTNAEAWRSGGMGNTGRLEGMMAQMMTVMQQVANNTAGGKQIVLDSGVLVGQLAPALDTQLGTISSRKGRRN